MRAWPTGALVALLALPLVEAPIGRADDLLVKVVVDLFEFRYYRGWGSCEGTGDKAGFVPSGAVALRGVNTGELSLGTARKESWYKTNGTPMCSMSALVPVATPDTVY